MQNVMVDSKRIRSLVSWRMVAEVIPSREAFEKALRSGRRLRIYFGIDPTGPDLHLGHAVSLFFLRDMQSLGHEVVLVVGDFTATIGDPTGRDAQRKPLLREQVLAHAKGYRLQAGKLLDFRTKRNPARLKFNSSWLSKWPLEDVLKKTQHFTIQQFTERDMFKRRLRNNQPIGLHEFFYPMLQGYDSLALGADVEVGGSDQLFNMLIGRDIMAQFGKKEKFVITVRLLVNPATGKKMSKSEGSYLPLRLPANEMYGAVMALHDDIIFECFELCTPLPQNEITALRRSVKKGTLTARDAKARLAREIVSWAYNAAAADRAADEFERTFVKKEIPSDAPTVSVSKGALFSLLEFLTKHRLASSKSDAKRLIEGKGVEIDRAVVVDWRLPWRFEKDSVVKVGKRKFLVVKVKE